MVVNLELDYVVCCIYACLMTPINVYQHTNIISSLACHIQILIEEER